MSRLGLRRRLLIAICAAVAAALVGIIAGFNLILSDVLERDARDLVRTRAVAQIDALRIDNGRINVREVADDRSADAFIWVFEAKQPLEQPRSSPAIGNAARSLADGPARYRNVPGRDTLLYAAPVISGRHRLGTAVAGVSLAPYEETRKLALLASLILGALVIVVVLVAARWLLAAALRPVARMTRQAAEWSEHDLDQRFGLGAPHDELTELSATLDSLLGRLAASLRHERRFSAEISHELRTPLARVLAESELALRRDRTPDEYRHALDLIHRNADQLSRTVDALVAAARYEAGGERGTADARAVAEGAAGACSSLAAEQQIDIQIAQPQQPLRIGIDPDLAERILQPLLENACRYGAALVRVGIGRDGSSIVYTIDDDGPGVDDADTGRIFEPGVRGTVPHTLGHNGAGLGLALARRLARSVDGEVSADTAAAGGRFIVRLPIA